VHTSALSTRRAWRRAPWLVLGSSHRNEKAWYLIYLPPGLLSKGDSGKSYTVNVAATSGPHSVTHGGPSHRRTDDWKTAPSEGAHRAQEKVRAGVCPCSGMVVACVQHSLFCVLGMSPFNTQFEFHRVTNIKTGASTKNIVSKCLMQDWTHNWCVGTHAAVLCQRTQPGGQKRHNKPGMHTT